MKKEMLINVLQPEECRIAIVEDGVLEELYVERTSQESYVGNIYKGRIVNIEPSIQAAFVDFGIGRNGFLHVSDVEPAYYRHLETRRDEPRGGSRGGRRDTRRRRPEDSDDERDDAPSDRGERPEEIRSEEIELLTREAETEVPADDAAQAPLPADEDQERGGRRGRGRGRGRGRRRSGPREERTSETGGGAEAAPNASSQESDASSPPSPAERDPEDPPPPRFMETAEHRTEPRKDDSPPRPIDDADIFFPRDEPVIPAARFHEAEDEKHESGPEFDTFAEEPNAAETERDGDSDDEDSFVEQVAPRLDDEEAEELDEPEEFLNQADAEAAIDLDMEDEGPEESSPPPRRPRRDDRRDDRRPRRDDRRPQRGRRVFGRPGTGRPKPLIQDIFKRGQEVLVQVIKEGIGTKGPTLSTYISIAGRYLVLMPGLNRIGVSRKIDDDEQRRRLREILHELQPPKGLGFIIRTAGLDRTKKELQRDLAYLSRLWQVVVRRIRKTKSPCEIYQESDMITRTIRDTFTSEIDSILVDEPNAFEHAQEFMQIVMPRYAERIQQFTSSEPMFHKYGIEDEISRIQMRHVPLPMGGSIVIDQTEALVAIDVNSGNFRADNNAEETAYRMNLLAAKEIARQLRLRDLGGVIVNDFIDMREDRHRRDVERALRDAVRRDRARTKILRISAFGIIEMTRQRIRPSLKRSVYQDCPHCHATGQVKTIESMSIDVMRMLQLAAHRKEIVRITAHVHEDVAHYLNNKKRREISRLEEAGQASVTLSGRLAVPPEFLEFVCFDNNNNEIKFLTYEESRPRKR